MPKLLLLTQNVNMNICLKAIGGRYFNISLSSEHHINPFDLPIPTEDETTEDVYVRILSNLSVFSVLCLADLLQKKTR